MTAPFRTELVGDFELAKLNPAGYNPRKMDDESRKRLEAGLLAFGIVDPFIARAEDYLLVGGHQRLVSATNLHITHGPVVLIYGLDDNQAAALNILLNNPHAQGEWDMGKLSEILSQLDANGFDATLTGFDESQLEGLLAVEPSDAPEEADDVDLEPPVKAKSKPGTVYQLGRHRLLCGDSTDPAAWRKLLAGETLDMVWTDPPYGIAYVGKTKDALTIKNDNIDEEALDALLEKVFSNLVDNTVPSTSPRPAARSSRCSAAC